MLRAFLNSIIYTVVFTQQCMNDRDSWQERVTEIPCSQPDLMMM